ncbi:MAG: glycosyltransferase [bacterium]
MRVVWATQVYPRRRGDVLGGFLHRLARELPAHGIEVTVVAPEAEGAPARERLDDVDVVRFPLASPAARSLAYTGEMHRVATRSPLAVPEFLRAFRRAISSEIAKATLVHAHWWIPTGLAAMGSARAAGRPYVVSLHGTDVRLLERWTIARPFAARVLGRARVVLPVSEFLAEPVRRWVPPERLTVLPMPVDADTFSARSAPRTDELLVVARLTKQKRVDVALRALAILRRTEPHRTLRICGDGPERDPLATLARELGLEDAVFFDGLVPAERLAGLLAKAAALVAPFEREGYGLVVVEAARCECPVVVARSGALPEAIERDRAGWSFTPGDAEDLARAVRDVDASAPERSERVRRARERADRLTAAPLAAELVRIYHGISRS